tara:strand:+ start:11034 stop:11420 length:387 start_codon:yes stop_codon:yes gene_type:complete
MSFQSKLPANYVWWVERERVGIMEYAKGSDISCLVPPTGVSAGLKAGFYITRRANDFTVDLAENSELPPQFHEALAWRVISMGYLSGKNLNPQLAQQYDGLYMQKIKQAKKYAKRQHTYGGFITPVDF